MKLSKPNYQHMKLTIGFFLMGIFMTLQVHGQTLYYSEGSTIKSIDVDGTNGQTILSNIDPNPRSVGYDQTNDKILYNAFDSGEGFELLYRFNTDGTAIEVVADSLNSFSSNQAFAIDQTNAKLYWFEFQHPPAVPEPIGIIKRANLDGTSEEVVYTSTPLWHMLTMIIDEVNSKIIFTSFPDGIHSIDFNGDNYTNLYPSRAEALAIEHTNNKIIFGRRVPNTFNWNVYRMNFDGSNVQIIMSQQFPNQFAVDEQNDKLYFAQAQNSAAFIKRSNLDGSDLENFLANNPLSYGVAIAPADEFLPIELSSFNVSLDQQEIIYTWEEATRSNVDRIEAQYAINGIDFRSIGIHYAEESNTGDETYEIKTQKPIDVEEIMYCRLRVVDVDGSESFSAIRSLHIGTIDDITFHPNPVKDRMIISSEDTLLKKVALFDLSGNLLIEKYPSSHLYELDVHSLPPGLYMLNINNTFEKIVKL